jgi:hypothetical protein
LIPGQRRKLQKRNPLPGSFVEVSKKQAKSPRTITQNLQQS